jgi:hypothetical protein
MLPQGEMSGRIFSKEQFKNNWGQTYTIDICYKLEISRIAIRLF